MTDPREILANVKVLLNNFTGTVVDQSNVLNVYGLLERNTDNTDDDLKADNRLRATGDSVYTDGTLGRDYDLRGDADGIRGFESGSFTEIFGFRFNTIDSELSRYW